MGKLRSVDSGSRCKFALCKNRPTIRVSQGKIVIKLCGQHFRHYEWREVLGVIFNDKQPVKVMGKFK